MGIRLDSTLVNGNERNWYLTTNNSQHGLLEFYVSPAAGGVPVNSVLALDRTGNVGIGTSSPGAALDVRGAMTSGSGALLLRNGDNAPASNSAVQIIMGYNNSGSYASYIRTRHAGGAAAGNAIDFYTGDGTGGGVFPTNAVLGLSINGGNVGVGTLSPEGRVDVVGSTQGDPLTLGSEVPALILEQRVNGSSIGPMLEFRNDNGAVKWTAGAIIGNASANYSGSLSFYTQSGGFVDPSGRRGGGGALVEQMRISKDGNVGVGTTAPDQGRVEVKGGSVCVDTNNDDNATTCIASESDARLKANVAALDVSLDTFMKLRPVSFDWKFDDPEVLKHYPLIARFSAQTHSIGLIAQEVGALVPEAIEPETVGDKDVQYFQLDYTKLVPVIIKAVQDLKHMMDGSDAKVEALTVIVQTLQTQNAELAARLKTLEAAVLTPEAQHAK